MSDNKSMEALIRKLESELNEHNKDELLKIMSTINMTEAQDDPVFYLLVKQLTIDTKLTTISKQTDKIGRGLEEVEKALFVLVKKMDLNLDTEKLTDTVRDAVMNTIAERLPDKLEVSVVSSDNTIHREVRSQIMPLLKAVNELKQAVETETLKKDYYFESLSTYEENTKENVTESLPEKKGTLLQRLFPVEKK